MLLCYIYRHFAWSIKLEIVMLWGEKCQLTAMVTTDAEIYKRRAFLWLAIPSQRREMASCSIRLHSRQSYIFALQEKVNPFYFILRPESKIRVNRSIFDFLMLVHSRHEYYLFRQMQQTNKHIVGSQKAWHLLLLWLCVQDLRILGSQKHLSKQSSSSWDS